MAGTQPIWLLGCPIKGHFIAKKAFLAFSSVGVLLIVGLLISDSFLTSVNFLEDSVFESDKNGSGLMQGQIIFLKILLNFMSKNPYITTLKEPFTTAAKSKSDTARVLLHMRKYVAPKMTDWQVMLQTRNTKMTAITFFVIKS